MIRPVSGSIIAYTARVKTIRQSQQPVFEFERHRIERKRPALIVRTALSIIVLDDHENDPELLVMRDKNRLILHSARRMNQMSVEIDSRERLHRQVAFIAVFSRLDGRWGLTWASPRTTVASLQSERSRSWTWVLLSFLVKGIHLSDPFLINLYCKFVLRQHYRFRN
jgi:hypothetical protein